MRQILQNLGTGATEVVEAPKPNLRSGEILVDTSTSLISIGTERMLVDFGKAGLIAKARSQPEKVKQVLDKARTDGLGTTISAVKAKLSEPIPLGYSNVGSVRESRTQAFSPGDRVVSNGPHADVVAVPQNLAAKIPANVSNQTAAFTVVASIGLQGIRIAQPTIGEAIVVTGVGLIGLLTVQMLRAHGCRVLAIDFDDAKLALAKEFGAEICNPANGEDPVAAGVAFSRGAGVDAVIVTASTTSSDPISHAAQMCRKRGRIVLVGVTGLELNRSDFYEKELSFQVSCSYGPGRYDPDYEANGHDYPIGYVRWTEQRNFEAVLDLMSAGLIDVSKLVTHKFDFDDGEEAYEVVTNNPNALGILLEYSHDQDDRHATQMALQDRATGAATGAPRIGFIGAGNYASRVLIPAFRAASANLHTVASNGGTSAVIQGKRAGFAVASSDADSLFINAEIDAIVIATRHDSHAELCAKALQAGKHVFVEKPLALTIDQLEHLQAAYEASDRELMVGFNRRFAPHIVTMKRHLDRVAEPKCFVFVMNSGAIPSGHWTHDPSIGGGRIIGEACHHVDLMRFLADSPIVSVQARRMGKNSATAQVDDKAAITLGFADGSFGTIHYLANGSGAFPKERIEVFASGRTLQLDNFIRLRAFGWPGFRGQRLWRQDKGQNACAKAFVETLRTGAPSPIPPAELFETAMATLRANVQLSSQD